MRTESHELYRRAEQALPTYVTTNTALRDLRVLEWITGDVAPDGVYFRLTVHPKGGEPRPKLIPVGRYAKKPGVFPMRTLGVRAIEDGQARCGATWEVAARLEGWTPVLDATGAFSHYRPS